MSRIGLSPVYIFSPLGMLAISFIMQVVAIAIPTTVYNNLLHENIRNFDYLLVITWITFCNVAFLIGYSIAKPFNIIRSQSWKNINVNLPILLMVIFASTVHIIAITVLTKNLGGISGYISAISGTGGGSTQLDVYYALKSASIGSVPLLMLPLIYLLYFIYLRSRQPYVLALIVLCSSLYLSIVLASQNKGPILSLIISLFFIYTLNISSEKSKKNFWLSLLMVIIIAIVIFIIIQSRRNISGGFVGYIAEFIGYFLASYTRLGYVLNGEMTIPNSSIAYFTNTWLWGLPFATSLAEYLNFNNFTDSFSAWLKTFNSVSSVGLNPRYIWITLYGEVYIDYKLLGALWFFLYGVASRIIWRMLNEKTIVGIIIYPLFVIAGLQWFSGANITSRSLLVAIILVIFIDFWSKISIRSKTNTIKPRLRKRRNQ